MPGAAISLGQQLGDMAAAETLCVMDGKKAAAMVERELIRDGNPTGGRLINKVHNPERRPAD